MAKKMTGLCNLLLDIFTSGREPLKNNKKEKPKSNNPMTQSKQEPTVKINI